MEGDGQEQTINCYTVNKVCMLLSSMTTVPPNLTAVKNSTDHASVMWLLGHRVV